MSHHRRFFLFALLLPAFALVGATTPKVDAKRIINESSAFLKEREPEMTAEEYALYQKVVTMIASQPEFALKLLEAMMSEKEKPSPAFEFILGNAYYAAGQTARAETRYRSAVDRFPSFLRAWNNLGVLYYTADKFADAVPCFAKSLTLGDRDPTTFGLLGYCLEKLGKVAPAEMAYMQALASDPNNSSWMEGLARIYMQGKQYSRADSLVKDLIKDHPQEAQYWLMSAHIQLAENRPLEAIALLEASLGAGVAGPDELNLLADLYVEKGLFPEAMTIYQKTLASSPAVGEKKLLQLAQVLIGSNKLAPAQDALAALKSEVAPANRIDFLQVKADLSAARKQWPDARRILDELLKLEPLNGKALLSLGRAYVAEDDRPHAIFAFEAASQLPEYTYRACLELANIELKNRHYEKTVEYLEKALSIEKSAAIEDYLAHVKTLVVKNG